jgi:hypothetical protein
MESLSRSRILDLAKWVLAAGFCSVVVRGCASKAELNLCVATGQSSAIIKEQNKSSRFRLEQANGSLSQQIGN